MTGLRLVLLLLGTGQVLLALVALSLVWQVRQLSKRLHVPPSDRTVHVYTTGATVASGDGAELLRIIRRARRQGGGAS